MRIKRRFTRDETLFLMLATFILTHTFHYEINTAYALYVTPNMGFILGAFIGFVGIQLTMFGAVRLAKWWKARKAKKAEVAP